MLCNAPRSRVRITNILIIKLRYIGDVLLSTPVIPVLERHVPHAGISFLVNAGTETVLAHDPRLQEVIPLARGSLRTQIRFLRMLRSRRYDCVIDLTDGDRSAFISVVTGAPVRLGFSRARCWRRWCYTECVEGLYGAMHMLEYHAKILECLGIRDVPGCPQLFVSEDEERAALRTLDAAGLSGRPWVMIHPAARYRFKAWPAERFAAVGDALQTQGFQVVLVGSRNDRFLAAEILRHAHRPFVSLVGRTSLLELAALMKHCHGFIGNDAGPMQIAAAMGCAVIALFGPSNPAVWGPKGARVKTIYKGLDCRECFYPGCFRGEQSCMNLITVEEVMAAAEELLRDPGMTVYGKGESGA